MTCMITAYANIDTAIAATRQGVDFFLPKPFSARRPAGRGRDPAPTQAGPRRGRAAAPGARGQPAGAGRGEDPDPLPRLVAARRRPGGQPGRRRRAGQPGHDRPPGPRRRQRCCVARPRSCCGRPAGPARRAAGRPAQGPHHRSAVHRRADLHDQHRDLPRRGRRRAGPHPHPVRHLPGAAPGHGEGALHPHHGPRAQVAAGSGPRASSRWPPTRAWATTSRPTCPCCTGRRTASTAWCSSSATCCRSRGASRPSQAEPELLEIEPAVDAVLSAAGRATRGPRHRRPRRTRARICRRC